MTSYRTARVEGLDVFYREAGKPTSPKLLLLGGFPASSHQFRDLVPALAERFHVVAPDYPGFGNTDMPDPATWAYTFDHLAEIVDGLLTAIGFVGPMGIYMHDYGGPIGNRLIAAHPERLQWQILQNANAYEEGLSPALGAMVALWDDRGPETEAPLEAFFELDTIKAIYTSGHTDVSAISPDNWNSDLYFLARAHARRVHLDLFFDYRTNVAAYPAWQEMLRRLRPHTLILWGQGDMLFTPAGGEAYLRDLPDAEIVRLDSGHFATEDRLDDIVHNIVRFYDETVETGNSQ